MRRVMSLPSRSATPNTFNAICSTAACLNEIALSPLATMTSLHRISALRLELSSAGRPQQYQRHPSLANTSNALTCGLPWPPTQPTRTNAQDQVLPLLHL